MKKLFMFLTILSIKSFASGYAVQYMDYTVEQLRNEKQCSVATCRANDKGKLFQDVCLNDSGMNYTGQDSKIRVAKSLGAYGDCYCPCTTAFLYQVMWPTKCE